MGEPRSAIGVPFAIPRAIESIRRRHVPVARLGVPPHVTILSPFLPAAALDDAVRTCLARLAGNVPTFEVRFAEMGAFPDALYLEPDPDAPFRRLVGDVVEAFPGYNPYGEPMYRPEEVVPHLTIAIGEEAGFEGLVARVRPHLPFTRRAGSLIVVTERSDGRWDTHWRVSLRP